VIISTLCTIAFESSILYTAASSLLFKSISTFSSSQVKSPIASVSSPGANLAAQPAAFTYFVSFASLFNSCKSHPL